MGKRIRTFTKIISNHPKVLFYNKYYIVLRLIFREVFQKDFDDEDLNRLELKIETRAKIKEMLVDTKKENNTIVKYLSYSKGSQAQKGKVHLYYQLCL